MPSHLTLLPQVRTIREVREQEEITISYVDTLLSRASRRYVRAWCSAVAVVVIIQHRLIHQQPILERAVLV